MTANCHLNSKLSFGLHFTAFIAITSLLLGINPASAQQTSVSDQNPGISTTYNWSSAATWTSGGIPTNGPTPYSTNVMICRIYLASWNDDIARLTNNCLINGGQYANYWSGSGGATLVFDGAKPSFINTNRQGYSYYGLTVQLNADTLFTSTTGANAPGCVQNNNIIGVGAMIVSNPVSPCLVQLNQNNSFTGGLNLQAGRLVLNNAGCLGTGTLTIGDGTQLESATANLVLNKANPVVVNGNFAVGTVNSFNWGTGAVNLGTLAGTARTITVTNAGVTLTVSGPVANGTTANGITKAGAGTLTLNGTNTYTGATTVSAGTLNIGTVSAGGGSFATADGSTLGVNVTAGTSLAASSITLGSSTGGNTLTFNLGAGNPTANVVNDSGTLTVNGTVTVNVTGSGLSGTNVLISYNSLAGSGNFVAGAVPALANYTATIVNDTVNKKVKLVYAYTPLVKWAVGSGSWDTSSLNWTNPSAVSPLTNYVELSSVLFDDTASGSSPIAVNLTAARTPGVVTNNSTKNYSFTGSGISGTAALVKLGASTLTLANANTYTGGTTISAGTLQLGDGSANNGSVAGTITDNAALTVANPAAQTISGVISGTGSLAKSGAGTLTFTAANTYAGGTTISAGTLQLGDGSTLNGSVAANITNNAALAVANPTTQTLTNAISGTGSFTKSGAGALTLTGASTYSGATTVSAGTLTVNTLSTGAGSYTVANGNTLGVTVASTGTSLTNSSLTLGTSAATTLTFNLASANPTSPVIVDKGALNMGGTVTVNVTTTGTLSAGTIVLMSYNSGGSGTFVAGSLPSVAGVTASLIKDTVNKQLKLVFAPLQTMVWNVGDGAWDTGTANWTNAISANSLTTYFENSPVQFDDTAPGSSPITVTTSTNHTPGNVVITNSAIAYVLTDGGVGAGINGVASLTKTGNGILQLSSSNSYTGGTFVKGGTVVVANASAFGSPSGSILVTVTNGGSINLNQNIFTNATQYVAASGSGIDSTHGAIYAVSGQSSPHYGTPMTGVRNVRFTGDTAIGGDGNPTGPGSIYYGVWSLGVSQKGQVDGTAQNLYGSIDAQNHNITKVGNNWLVLFATNASPAASFTIAGGYVEFQRTPVPPFGTNCPIIIENGSGMDTWDLSGLTAGTEGQTIPNNITLTNGGGYIRNTLGSYYYTANQDVYSGTITLNDALTILNTSTYNGGPSFTPSWGKMTFNGVIAGTNNFGVTVVGPSTQFSGANHYVVFNATNTYNGTTELQNYVTLQTTTLNRAGGAYLIDDNAGLDVLPTSSAPTLPTANLTVGSSAGATLSFARLTSLPATPVIYATNLTINGTSQLLLPSPATWAIGTYHLIKYEGTVGGAGVAGLTLPTLPPGVTASLVDNTGNQSVDLVVTSLSSFLWVGNVSADWDTGLTANWSLGGATTYADGDYVGFDDSASSFIVNITNNVSPGLVTVNAPGNYSFGGNFAISGSTALVKSGTGTLTVSNMNSFTGGTTLNAGEIDLGSTTPLGTGLVTVNGGTLAAVGSTRTLANNVAIGSSFKAGGQGQNLVLNGTVNLGGATPTITLGNFLTVGGQISNGGLTATSAGGYRELVLAAANTYAGGTIANGGAALRVNNATGSGTGSGSVTVNSGSTLWGSGTIAGPVSFNAGSHFIGATFQILTLTNSLTIATTGTIPDVQLSLSNNVPVGNYILATYNTNGSSGAFNSTPTISGGSLAAGTAGTILTTNGTVVLQVVATSTTPPNFPPGGVSVLPTGNISLVSTGAIGGTYRLWATTNLALTPITNTWTLINSGTITTSPFTNIDLNATNYHQRFYIFSNP